jgi:outer membrane receptor protein involved in Fe transport
MKRGILAASLLAGAVSCVASAAFAQSDASSIETVIVTGKKIAQDKVPMKAVFTQSTISKETILNASPSPATNVQTLLNTEPSIYAVAGGPNGVNTTIKFRSFSDGEFGETIEGVPLNDIFNGGVTFQADNRNNVLFTTQDIDSVQIYRGVNNPAVNTYNSLGGTINYDLRQPTDTFGGSAGIDGGSFNTFNYHAMADTGDVDGIKQTLSYERDFSSGWLQNSPDWNENLYYAGKADITSDTQIFAYAVFNQNKGDAPEDVPVNLIREFGDSYQYPNDFHTENNNDQNAMGIVGIKQRFSDVFSFEDTAYIGDNNYRRTSYTNPADEENPYYIYNAPQTYAFWASYIPYTGIPQFGSTAAGTAYQFYGYHGSLYGDDAKVTADLPFNKVIAGGDFNVGELHSREFWYGSYDMPMETGYNDAWNEHDTRQMWSLFIQDDIHFWDDRIHITPGVKYIDATSKDNDAVGFYYFPPGNLKNTDHFLSPTLGASIEPIENFTIYGSYGKNVKFPDITSLYNELGYGGVVPPATVKPENVADWEIGARYKWDSLQVEVNGYEEHFSDIIYSIQLPSGASFQQNGGLERYRGVETQLTDDFGEVFIGNLKGFLNASYNEAICESDFGYGHSVSDTTGGCNKGQSLANVPNYLLSGGLTWDYQGWHVDVTGQFVGKQHLEDYYTYLPEPPSDLAPGQPTHIPSYVLFNLGVVKVIPINIGPANALRLSVHVDNIFNTHYFADAETDSDANNSNYLNDVYARVGEPRAVFGSISIYF